jgi:hypothetical protein
MPPLQASDVWAFATTIWTMYTGQSPFHRYRLVDVQRKVPDGLRLSQPPNCTPEVYSLLATAWSNDPELRPPFSALASALEKQLSSMGFDAATQLGIGERLNPTLATLRNGQKLAALEEFVKTMDLRDTNAVQQVCQHCSNSCCELFQLLTPLSPGWRLR